MPAAHKYLPPTLNAKSLSALSASSPFFVVGTVAVSQSIRKRMEENKYFRRKLFGMNEVPVQPFRRRRRLMYVVGELVGTVVRLISYLCSKMLNTFQTYLDEIKPHRILSFCKLTPVAPDTLAYTAMPVQVVCRLLYLATRMASMRWAVGEGVACLLACLLPTLVRVCESVRPANGWTVCTLDTEYAGQFEVQTADRDNRL